MTHDPLWLLVSAMVAVLASAALIWLAPRRPVVRRWPIEQEIDTFWMAPVSTGLSHATAGQAATPDVPFVSPDEMAFYRLAIEYTSDVVIRFDAKWRCLFVSPSCREVFGYGAREFRAMHPFRLVHPDDRAALRAEVTGIGLQTNASWRALHRRGHSIFVEAMWHSIGEDGGSIAVLRDVTPYRLAEGRLIDARDQLRRMASLDSLTGLPNRDAFTSAAGRHLNEGGELAFLSIDLAGFHKINDAHGHAAGDAVLREIAARLKRELMLEPMVARFAADKFGALVSISDGDQGIAARVRGLIGAINEPLRLDEVTLTVEAVVGISVCPRDGKDAAALMRNAEIALTRAKQSNGGAPGTYRFHEPAMGLALERSAHLRRDLRAAIRDGRIVPWFQPVIRLDDMELVAFEALARWEHPTLGILEPAMFLPLVEDMGASTELFAALLSRACQAARSWPASVGLSVNISPRELHDPALPDTVARILRDTGFDGTRLEIELNESGLIHDPDVARDVLEELRGLGLSVALDDFGTGFSSLYHLRELPFDKVKIDGSFMRVLSTDAECARFVAAIIGLGHSLGLELTAEGIEDEAALARLKELGCTYGQGNWLGRPARRPGLREPVTAAAFPEHPGFG